MYFELGHSLREGLQNVASKKHVFISYFGDNREEVAKLRDELLAAGETVWWDKDIQPGQDWRQEIRQAMRDSYAVLLCLSDEGTRRATSWLYPEALDAIGEYRRYRTGEIFLIPVRLNDCELPSIEIDSTRTLDALQAIDLFPPARRGGELARLLQALRAAPLHPPQAPAPDGRRPRPRRAGSPHRPQSKPTWTI